MRLTNWGSTHIPLLCSAFDISQHHRTHPTILNVIFRPPQITNSFFSISGSYRGRHATQPASLTCSPNWAFKAPSTHAADRLVGVVMSSPGRAKEFSIKEHRPGGQLPTRVGAPLSRCSMSSSRHALRILFIPQPSIEVEKGYHRLTGGMKRSEHDHGGDDDLKAKGG